MESIGRQAFWGCDELNQVISLCITPPIANDRNFRFISKNAILFIPVGTRQQYEDTGWSQYFSKTEEFDVLSITNPLRYNTDEDKCDTYRYDLSGKRVDNNYKGLVISKGKKFISK